MQNTNNIISASYQNDKKINQTKYFFMHTQNVSLSRQLRNSTLPNQKETYGIILIFTDIECFDTDFNILMSV